MESQMIIEYFENIVGTRSSWLNCVLRYENAVNIGHYEAVADGKDTRNCQEKMKEISHFKPNQIAPSIYIMKELCFFSHDQ